MTRRLVAAAVALIMACLSACSDGAPPPSPVPIQTTSPSWVMAPGTYAEYRVSRGRGVYDVASGMITIDQTSMVDGEVTRITNLPYQMGQGPAVARVYSPGGTTAAQVPAGLTGALVERSTGAFIGEAANAGAADQSPPEPLLSLTPVAGETFTIHSTIAWMAGGTLPDFVTRYRTISVGTSIDGFTNTVVTTLVENPDTPNVTAYVQVFDGELAELWSGAVANDNSVDVIMLRRVGTGRNP